MSQSGGRTTAADGDRPTVVAGVDGWAMTRAVLVHALSAAARRGADLEVVAGVPVELGYLGGAPLVVPDVHRLHEDVRDRVRSLIDEVRADAGISAVPGVRDVAIRLLVLERRPASALVDRSRDAQLLVVGSRGRGAGRSALLGSVALHCATHASCPVVVVHPPAVATDLPPRVVVGVDGSAASRIALDAAMDEAARRDGVVEVVTSYRLTDYWTDLSSVVLPSEREIREHLGSRVRETVDAVRAERGAAGAPPVHLEVAEGPAGQVLVQRSSGAELLVVGSRGRGAFRALLLGSVALHCAMHAPCPVMVVRPGQGRAASVAAGPAMAGTGRWTG